MESVTRLATTSHFLLMFGYKLFSFFFPLYLAQQGFSLPEVGYTYLLIYLPIALFAPAAAVINNNVRPLSLALIGIAGYALYSLAMMANLGLGFFYLAQVLLGISAACFFISIRVLFIDAKLPHPDRSFGYFYAAPNAAEALAPAVGAAIIFFSGFPGVFLASLAVHLANMLFVWKQRPAASAPHKPSFPVPTYAAYRSFGKEVLRTNAWPLLLVSFVVLFVGGIYHPFFVIFLENLGWTHRGILIYGAVFSAVFVPISYLVARYALRTRSSQNVYGGSLIFALGGIVFGLLARRLEFVGVLALALVRGAGGLMTSAGRSGHLSRAFRTQSEPAAVVDTMLSPLGTALGALLGGFLLLRIDFGSLFTQAGILVVAVTVLTLLLTRPSP